MRLLTFPMLFLLSAISVNSLAETVQKICPPASALHHPAPGQAWTLDEPYKSEGWQVMQTPLSNWSRFNSIRNNAILSVRVHEEGNYIQTGVIEKFGNTYGAYDVPIVTYPITCSYNLVYTKDNLDNRAVTVTSPYTTTITDILDTKAFQVQNDCVNYENSAACQYQESNWGFVCNTTAGNPAACEFKVLDINSQPKDELLMLRKKSAAASHIVKK